MFRLVKTTNACPEQYDVYVGEEQVGYMRLRHGHFRAEYKDKVVFNDYPEGQGSFNDNERHEMLTKACKAIKKAMKGDLYVIEDKTDLSED